MISCELSDVEICDVWVNDVEVNCVGVGFSMWVWSLVCGCGV